MSGVSGVTDQLMSNIAINVAPLIAQPDMTVWRHVHMRYTDFVLAPVEINMSALNWGNESRVEIDRPGELAFFTYLLLDLPGICVKNDVEYGTGGVARHAGIGADTADEHVEPYWIKGVGHAAVESAKVHIGTIEFDELTSLWLHSWEQLSAPAGRKLAEMVGDFETHAMGVRMSREKRRLYVPLTFWFTQHPGLALPLASINFSKVTIQVTLRHFNKLIRIGEDNTDVDTTVPMSTNVDRLVLRRPDNAVAARTSAGTPNTGTYTPVSTVPNLNVSDVSARLEITYVFLTPRERSRFLRGSFQQLMQQHRYHRITTTSTFNDVKLPFNLAITSILFVVRTADSIRQNDLFNFAGPESAVTELETDPVASLRITVSSNTRVDKREGRYFRLVVPYQHHTNVPAEFIYTYSFALAPEDPVQPSGTLNGAKTDSIHFEVELTDSAIAGGPCQIDFMASLINMCRFTRGGVGLRFNS